MVKKKSHNSNIMEKSNNTIFRRDKARHLNPWIMWFSEKQEDYDIVQTFPTTNSHCCVWRRRTHSHLYWCPYLTQVITPKPCRKAEIHQVHTTLTNYARPLESIYLGPLSLFKKNGKFYRWIPKLLYNTLTTSHLILLGILLSTVFWRDLNEDE